MNQLSFPKIEFKNNYVSNLRSNRHKKNLSLKAGFTKVESSEKKDSTSKILDEKMTNIFKNES